MTVAECEIPAASLLDRQSVETAWFKDSYRVPLSRKDAGVTDIFLGIFAHHPWWMKAALIIRNRIARLVGLAAPTASEIINVEIRNGYRVGDTIGVWLIYSLNETELVTGRDNKHLDFRLSVWKEPDGAGVVVSTICMVHNTFGKVYLFFIVPFHKWGVRRLLSTAAATGRI